MNILGIETSCDETAAAVVKGGTHVLSNIVVSSLKEHASYGGIIPEIASRRQSEWITAICGQALSKAKLNLNDIDAIAVTNQPGLIGSLLVGLSFARALSYAMSKPLILVNHIKAHAYANFLKFPATKTGMKNPGLPAVALVASGGHTNLFYIKAFDQFRLLGQTLDDAAGEAFDKAAKILDLGFPGGPAIDRLAKKGTHSALRFKCATLPGTHNFSFSGIKTAVLYHHRDHKQDKNFSVNQVAYAFQKSIVSVLVQKCITACQKLKTKTLLIGGGVAANTALRQQLNIEAGKQGINVYIPPFSVCTDNAAMIAGLGYHLTQERRN